MEFRKEKTKKSKELIRKQFKSDIFNISTGYYKTENILPITPKPNELKDNINEFIPKYKEMKPSIRLFNDLLSHKQKLNYSFNYSNKKIKFNLTRQNSEVQILRGYTKIIRDNCFDEKGNFSARKRYRLEFYGKENVNYKKLNKSFSYTIKDKRKKSFKNTFQKIQNNKENVKSCKNIFSIETPRKNDINNYNFKSLQNDYKKIKNNNFTKIDTLNQLKSPSLQTINHKIKNEKKISTHRRDIKKEFYTKTNHPINNNKKTIKNRDSGEKEYFDIEIKNSDIHCEEPLVDQKKLKQIFLKNGLHIYDFNDDGMNILFKDKKFKAKLRKNKKDENFDKNYRNVIRELNKINVKVNRHGIINETGFINKNVQRKRKGTPGKNLLKNKENKDENTKLNTGFTIKRDKYILPQKNLDYKNGYNYQMKVFNHNKKK